MVKFILGLVTGVILVFLSFVLLFFVLLRFREKPPEIGANSVLVLRLAGEIPEKAPIELPDFLGGGKAPLTVVNIYSLLRKAAADPNIRAVVVQPDSISAGWAKLEEIRSDLEQFHKSGKPIFAFLRQPTTREYYISLPADRIYLGDQEPVYVKGLRAETMYFKKTLDKIGVTVDVEHAGKYKDFGDMFTRTDMSPETREVIGGIGGRSVRQHGRPHRRCAQEDARPGARHHRRRSIHRDPGAESRPCRRDPLRRSDVGRAKG